MDQLDGLISLREFCDRVRISRSTAYSWKNKQFGPPMVRVGARQFYRKSDVAAFITALTAGAGDRGAGQHFHGTGRPLPRLLKAITPNTGDWAP
jgi:predicted DNA-binding transcriptional regulator AlpA